MIQRITTLLAVSGLALGGVLAAAGTASASTGPARYTHTLAGYQAGTANESWRFRYVQGSFFVSPASAGHIAQVAELTTSGRPDTQILGTGTNTSDDAAVAGVTWAGGSHVAAYACPTGGGSGGFGTPHITTLLDGNGTAITIKGGDPFSVSVFYDQGTNTIHYNLADHNPADPGSREVQCSVFSGDIFHGAFAGDAFLSFLHSSAGETVTTWTRTGLTTYNGTHATDGLKGGWQLSQVIDGDQGSSPDLAPTSLVGAAFALVAAVPHF